MRGDGNERAQFTGDCGAIATIARARMTTNTMTCDVLSVGGGVAGLFALDSLRSRGVDALLVESIALGSGQTTASQGILHAGVKYSLAGIVGEDADEVARAAAGWIDRLAEPDGDLARVRKLTKTCHIWRSSGVRAMLGMTAATLALQTRPHRLETNDRPQLLAHVDGDVMSLHETVIDPQSLCELLAGRHAPQLALGNVVRIARENAMMRVDIAAPSLVTVVCRELILAAGSGNEALAQLAGSPVAMQRRPLRQTFVRGELPLAFGHCIDGAKTRITITSDQCPHGEVVWNVGGSLAERGASMDGPEFEQYARCEIEGSIPGLSLRGCQIASLLVDRAEPRMAGGRRPPHAFAQTLSGLTTLWPVKLVLAPMIAGEIASRCARSLPHGSATSTAWPSDVQRPPLAPRPWQDAAWTTLT